MGKIYGQARVVGGALAVRLYKLPALQEFAVFVIDATAARHCNGTVCGVKGLKYLFAKCTDDAIHVWVVEYQFAACLEGFAYSFEHGKIKLIVPIAKARVHIYRQVAFVIGGICGGITGGVICLVL